MPFTTRGEVVCMWFIVSAMRWQYIYATQGPDGVVLRSGHGFRETGGAGVWGVAAASGPFARSAKKFWDLVTLLYKFTVNFYCKDVR